MKELGIYIHFPFCVSKCFYCNFNSCANADAFKEDYVKALKKEIKDFSNKVKNYQITTIYIGGGTPSTMSKGTISDILNVVYDNYNVSKTAEISIEANPNSITLDKAEEWKNAGVNRVSVGLQSSNDELLKIINRPHTKEDYLNAISILKRVGFKNINTDLMIGLPNQTLKDVKQSLNLVLKTKIPHVSAYSLILEEDTPLFKMVNSGQLTLPQEDTVLKMYDLVYSTLKKHKIHRYEVSNFAKESFKCRHNFNCWNMVEYVGFGVSANSFLDHIRWGNEDNIEEYISKVSKNELVIDFEERQSNEDLYDEYIMLKLRTTEGIDLIKLKDEYYYDILNLKKKEIDNLLKYKLIKIKDNFLSATNDGFKVLNQIILDLVC